MHQKYQGRNRNAEKIVRCFHRKVAESLEKNNHLVGHIPYTVKIINNIKRLVD